MLEKIWSSYFLRQLIYLGAFLLFLLLALIILLRIYTHHGQKLSLPDFQGMLIDEANDLAKEEECEIFIDDSVHIVGRRGGEILTQNPRPGSAVKEDRKVYVTTAKHKADVFLSSKLPSLYGKRFEYKAKELGTVFKLDCRIKDYKYDPGPPDHILEVLHNGKPIENRKGRNSKVEIAKGDVLEFILSKQQGGTVKVPDLRCQTIDEAKFLCQVSRVKLGNVVENTTITDLNSAYIVDQSPSPDAKTNMAMGEAITVYIQASKPANCP